MKSNEDKITERGKADGDAVGSWVIDGNTTAERAAEIFQGIEDCDSKILDDLPELQLGQWADDPSWEDILADEGIEVDEDTADDLWQVYQDAWSEGMTERVQRDARLRMPMRITLSQSDDDDGSVTAYCEDKVQAEHDQSIDGSRWECPSDMDSAYAMLTDRPTLVEDLQRDGYDVDDCQYSAPTDEDLAYWTYKCRCETEGMHGMDRDAWLAAQPKSEDK